MKQSLVFLSFVLALFLAHPLELTAQDKPAAGVELQLVDDQGKVIGTTKTKKDGSWSFNAPSDGNYSLVLVGGVEAASVAINTKGTGADKGKSAGQPYTATGTYSDGTTATRTVSGLESETEIVEFKLELTSDDVSIVSPRDVASGQSSGKRVHGALKVLKRLDKATPLLYKTASGGGGKIKGTMSWDLKTNTK